MKFYDDNDIKIVLENGISLPCKSFGYKHDVYSSFIFNTSIVGYEETLTDPSYKNEILIMSFPLQGIYGINQNNFESKKIHLDGFIIQELESNFLGSKKYDSLNKFLYDQKVIGVFNIDTRYLIKIIRNNGSLKGAIVDINRDKTEVINKLKTKAIIKNQVKNVSPTEIKILNPNGKKTIVFYDFGAKQSIKTNFIKRNYKLIIVPYNTKIEQVIKYDPEFCFFSNGPGNPNDLKITIIEIKKMIKQKIKLVGICLGHQLIALALNATIKKLNFGHHSTNHPVKNLINNKVYITSQNHNYSVSWNNFPKDIEVYLVSLNDNSIEGIKSKKYNIITTQFHPEASPGPNDGNLIFDQFIKFIKGE